MKTQKQALTYIKSKIGKGVDFDGMYGYQCADLVVDYLYYVTEKKVRMWGNAKDLINNDFKGLAKLYTNTPKFLAKPGDIVVWNGNLGGGYGHTAVVISATLSSITVIEQNWLGGGANKTEFATKRTHSYDNADHFIRPIFAKSKPKKQTKSIQNKWDWKGKFKANTAIKVRTSPSLKGKVVSGDVMKFTKVKVIKFNFIVKADGYWWISYTLKGKTYYSAICKITDKNGDIKKEKYWGTLTWGWK